MSRNKFSALKRINYDVAGGKIRFSEDYVARHTQLPKDEADIPHIIGWSGPARSGTSALLFLLAGHPQVDRAYYQPQKNLMRKGTPEFTLYAEDEVICTKEVFGSLYPEENYDPIKMLLDAGVPAEKITWIIIMRDPVQTFRSWHRRLPDVTPEFLHTTISHTINLYKKYKDTKVDIIPFAYELFEGQELSVLNALLERVGLSSSITSLDFDLEAIEQKLVKGQVAEAQYFQSNVQSVLDRKQFAYNRNAYQPPRKLEQRLKRLCQVEYEEFCEVVRAEFGNFKIVPVKEAFIPNLKLSLINVKN